MPKSKSRSDGSSRTTDPTRLRSREIPLSRSPPMDAVSCSPSRVETIIAATFYLMNAYRRTHCPRLAACVAAHLAYLTRHPDADPTIRAVCHGMSDEWRAVAERSQP